MELRKVRSLSDKVKLIQNIRWERLSISYSSFVIAKVTDHTFRAQTIVKSMVTHRFIQYIHVLVSQSDIIKSWFGYLQQQKIFVTVVQTGMSTTVCQHGPVLVRVFSLACRRPPACHARGKLSGCGVFSQKGLTSVIGALSTLITSSNCLPKPLSPIKSYWKLGLQFMNLYVCVCSIASVVSNSL